MATPKKRFNIELYLSLSATFLSLAALVVSIFQTKIAREQQQKTVLPYLQIRHELTDNNMEIFMENEGVGPAFIKRIEVIYGNDKYSSYYSFIENAMGDLRAVLDSIPELQVTDAKYDTLLKKNESLRVSMDWMTGGKDGDAIYAGSAIKEGEKQNIYRFTKDGSDGGPFVEWMRKSITDSTYQIRVTYSDVYDNCWQLVHKRNRNKVDQLSDCGK